MNQLASDACFDDDTYVDVSRIVNEATKLVATMLKAKGQVQQERKDICINRVKTRNNKNLKLNSNINNRQQ
jgi:hypothetical protein